MPHSTRHTLVDLGKKSIPQYFYEDGDVFEPNKGLAGGASSHALGSIYVDGWTGSTTETKPLPKPCIGLYIKNDGEGDIQITIGDKVLPPIKGGEPFSMLFEPFNSITVTVLTATTYRAIVAR